MFKGPDMDLKDHLEHLRTVHFSLLATCLVLLVVSTTSQNRTVKPAEDQLRSLQSVAEHWSDIDFDAAIGRQAQAFSVQVLSSKALKFSDSSVVPKAGWYRIDFTMPAWSAIRSQECTPWLYDPMIKRQPRTLADVHSIWDCLHTANSVAIPFAFSGDAAVVQGHKVPLQDAGSGTTTAGRLHLVFGKTSEDQRACIRQAFGLSVDYAFVGALYTNNGASTEIIVPVEKERINRIVGKEHAADQDHSLLTLVLEGNAIVDQNGTGRGSRGGQQEWLLGIRIHGG
jgi:hypothetical protein